MQICKKTFFFIKNITKHDIRTIAPEENCPRLGLGIQSRIGLVLGLGRYQGNCSGGQFPPWLEPEFGLGLVLGLGAIFLGGYCPRTS